MWHYNCRRLTNQQTSTVNEAKWTEWLPVVGKMTVPRGGGGGGAARGWGWGEERLEAMEVAVGAIIGI